MTLINTTKKLLILCIFLIVIVETISAQNNDKKDTYLILSLITNHLTKIKEAVPYPPKPINPITGKASNGSLTHQDSITMERSHLRALNKQYIIAIDKVLRPVLIKRKPILPEKCKEFTAIYKSFLVGEKETTINLENIELYRKDSLVYFKKEFKNNNRKEFLFIDSRIVFSNIEFDKTFSKAIVQVSYNTSKLAGISIIYFLEKVDKKWQITCEEGLSIS